MVLFDVSVTGDKKNGFVEVDVSWFDLHERIRFEPLTTEEVDYVLDQIRDWCMENISGWDGELELVLTPGLLSAFQIKLGQILNELIER